MENKLTGISKPYRTCFVLPKTDKSRALSKQFADSLLSGATAKGLPGETPGA
jgi:hypothetical protein